MKIPAALRLFQRPHARMPLHIADRLALQAKISRPLLDRIDIHIDVPAVN